VKKMIIRSLLALACTVPLSPCHGAVALPAIFSDHMVLQRDLAAPVWGTAEPGEAVTVAIDGQSHTVKANDKGHWRVNLEPMKAGGPHTLTVTASNGIEFKDVLVGEVWVGSGQSNMVAPVGKYGENDPRLAELGRQHHPQIRLWRGRKVGSVEGASWKEASPENLDEFSSLLFCFGQRLQAELDVPVGLIWGAVGGRPSGQFVTDAMLADFPLTKDAKGPSDGDIYRAVIEPVIPYGIRGVLWDQGEAGAKVRRGNGQYGVMGALIHGWRKAWGQGEFPFIYVQKPSGGGCAWDPENPVNEGANAFSPLPEQPPVVKRNKRAEFNRIMEHPNTAMVTTTDLQPGLHPLNKWGYGQRAARVALGLVYGRDVAIYGPVYDSHQIEGDKIRVRFKHVGQGLATRHGDGLRGFAVAGEDGTYHWADAVIDGDTVVVSSDAVPKPVAVQYAWGEQDIAWANLFNKDGLPAVTFRAANAGQP